MNKRALLVAIASIIAIASGRAMAGAPPRPAGPAASGQPVRLRMTNVDDVGRAWVNGEKVSELYCSENTCTNDTGWIDVSGRMKPGRNAVAFTLDNGKYGGWRYRFQLAAGEKTYDSGAVGRPEPFAADAPVLRLQLEVLLGKDSRVESISKPEITYFGAAADDAPVDAAAGPATVSDSDKQFLVDVPKGWTAQSLKDDAQLKRGRVIIHVYPAPKRLTALDAALEDIVWFYRQQGISPGPKQRLAFPGGEALWVEAPGSDRPYLAAVSRAGGFFFVNVEDQAKSSSGMLEAFLAALRSVRPAAPAAETPALPAAAPAAAPPSAADRDLVGCYSINGPQGAASWRIEPMGGAYGLSAFGNPFEPLQSAAQEDLVFAAKETSARFGVTVQALHGLSNAGGVLFAASRELQWPGAPPTRYIYYDAVSDEGDLLFKVPCR